MAVIEEAFKYHSQHPVQSASQWDFYMDGFSNMKFLIKDVSLPFMKLTAETAPNGEKYYTGAEFDLNVTFTIMETTDFLTLNFFMDWYSDIIDDELTGGGGFSFKSYSGAAKGSSADKIHKTGIFTFYTYQDQGSSQVPMIVQENPIGPNTPLGLKPLLLKQNQPGSPPEHSDGFGKSEGPKLINNRQIIDSILIGAIRNRVLSAVDNFTSILRPIIPAIPRPPPPTLDIPAEVFFPLKFPLELPLPSVAFPAGSPSTNQSNQKVKPVLQELSTQVFTLENMKLLGMEAFSATYDSGAPLAYNVTVTCDRVIPKAGSAKTGSKNFS